MSAAVESMAYTNDVPWHGLGKYKEDGWKNVKDMIKDAGIDWTVSRRPMFYATPEFADVVIEKGSAKAVIEKARHVADFAALVRDKDGHVLDVVGSRYQPRQNEQVFEFFDEFVRAGEATMETAGSLRGGRIVWGLANLKRSFKVGAGDKVKAYLLVAMFHQQGKANIYKTTDVRVVCNNTLTQALHGAGGFKDYHSSEFSEQTIERAKETLGIARETFGEHEATAKILLKTSLGKDDVLRVLAPIYQADEDIAELIAGKVLANAKLERVLDVLERAPGQTPYVKGRTNAWNVLNAVTYYSDHIASRSADRRLTQAWFGKTASQKETVLLTLKDMAA